ncbi:MAG: Mrp/NBP35 family ATP-binding protein [Candidatus Rokubacteria bacterium]|nr:Mrp/NBP35 family ATP-binding protein [Candidatus Rokubacteria bacterium]
MVTRDAVIEALRTVRDPGSGQDVVSLGMIQDLAIVDGQVTFTIAFADQPPPQKVAIHASASRVVGQVPGVSKVQVRMGGSSAARTAAHGPQGHAHAPGQGAPAAQAPGPGPGAPASDLIPDVRYTLAVSSGKGGVGKSTVAVNLAAALREHGAVGIVDSDVYGPDVPLMLGTKSRPGIFENRIIPVETHGMKMMSIGLLVGEREALVWRGPMIHSFIQQMLRDVMWGALDYLVFDMPPGTGDAQLSLSQVIPLSGVVMVTTPQDVALLDVRKAIGMFQRLNVPVLGIVENMSDFECPHCHRRTSIFGETGGQRLADEYRVPLLAKIPLEPETRIAGDEGTPISIRSPRSGQAQGFRELGRAVARRLEEAGALKPLPKIG